MLGSFQEHSKHVETPSYFMFVFSCHMVSVRFSVLVELQTPFSVGSS